MKNKYFFIILFLFTAIISISAQDDFKPMQRKVHNFCIVAPADSIIELTLYVEGELVAENSGLVFRKERIPEYLRDMYPDYGNTVGQIAYIPCALTFDRLPDESGDELIVIEGTIILPNGIEKQILWGDTDITTDIQHVFDSEIFIYSNGYAYIFIAFG
jgi:hypothetical protein